eukprot:6520163-Prymnesium_polylepis.1
METRKRASALSPPRLLLLVAITAASATGEGGVNECLRLARLRESSGEHDDAVERRWKELQCHNLPERPTDVFTSRPPPSQKADVMTLNGFKVPKAMLQQECMKHQAVRSSPIND